MEVLDAFLLLFPYKLESRSDFGVVLGTVTKKHHTVSLDDIVKP